MRFKTREIQIGNIGVGGSNPIRIQSMTTSNTRDVDATVDQILKLKEHGCEIVRMTVQGIKEAEACEKIKNRLVQMGVDIPLVADIHFYPPAAMHVVDFVDKVRINPGNFADRRASFKVIEYDDESYEKELNRIEEKFTPLVQKCKRLKKALRIGTNHGSLSDRIMNRYGNTPAGMVESAFEYARLCRKNDYHNFLFSMKSSNPLIMVEVYRLLVKEQVRLGWDYPIHLGVTEAGDGEDGRVKSALGIGSLLLEGIGDTIRVSLTEDPWYEIDPCKRLVNLAQRGSDPISIEESVVKYRYEGPFEELVIRASATCGAKLLSKEASDIKLISPHPVKDLEDSIMQAARLRFVKTDYIACPSCGRTLFNLQEVTGRIRSKTAHLPGVKIAIMGCIVNGPGEMADADFGYVGSKAGMIDLYVGKKCVERGIKEAVADERLIDLIKAHGRWQDNDSS